MNRMWMVVFWLLAAPLGVAGHGIALPITDSASEAKEAATQAQSLIRAGVDECFSEVSDQCSAANGLEESAKCLVGTFGALKSEACRSKVENVARYLPAAFHHGDHLKDFGNRTNRGCNANWTSNGTLAPTSDVLPYIWSYHMHIQWDFGSTEGYQTAMDFVQRFLKEFQPDAKICATFAYLNHLWNKNSVSPEQIDNHPFADICYMSTLPPGGPFFHSEKGFILSTTMFHRMLPWVLANRPLNDKLYIFLHPNSGCQYNDLRHWSMWVGPSVKMFFPILTGCVWAACEDETLGCIVWNHLGKNQGYGPCYDPPTSYGKPGMSLDCKMTIEPTSNTTTETCTKPKLSEFNI